MQNELHKIQINIGNILNTLIYYNQQYLYHALRYSCPIEVHKELKLT